VSGSGGDQFIFTKVGSTFPITSHTFDTSFLRSGAAIATRKVVATPSSSQLTLAAGTATGESTTVTVTGSANSKTAVVKHTASGVEVVVRSSIVQFEYDPGPGKG